MLFFSMFKTLQGSRVSVELKSSLILTGVLHSVDQHLNVKLEDVTVEDPEKHPQLLAVRNVFVRGSVIRYVHIPSEQVDTELLQDASRREASQGRPM
mmetsp:Transcript_27572/g.55119  ORF Transcript_27572/g.55119 Transcript_27572/m.55119 type:complete len:97 (-) Transcript_27572:29-319(-)